MSSTSLDAMQCLYQSYLCEIIAEEYIACPLKLVFDHFGDPSKDVTKEATWTNLKITSAVTSKITPKVISKEVVTVDEDGAKMDANLVKISNLLLFTSSASSSTSSLTPTPTLEECLNRALHILVTLDYFEKSLLYHLVKHDRIHSLKDWFQCIYEYFTNFEVPHDFVERFNFILIQCFTILCQKHWSNLLESLIIPLWEFGRRTFNWSLFFVTRSLVDSNNAMQHACQQQNLKLVLWLGNELLLLSDKNEAGKTCVDLWFESGVIYNATSTCHFIRYALESQYNQNNLLESINFVPNKKLRNQFKEEAKNLIAKKR